MGAGPLGLTDQYIALTLPLDGYAELDEFFSRFMSENASGGLPIRR